MSLWQKITGRVIIDSLLNQDELIQIWHKFYKGEQDRDYDYVALDGRKHTIKRMTMNTAKMICVELSVLVWSERPELNTDDGVKDFLNENNFFDKMQKYSEYGAALGGFAVKLYAPEEKKLRIDFVSADYFVPVTWDNNTVAEADFISRKVEDSKTFIYVEQHRKNKSYGYNITVIKRKELDDTYAGRAEVVSSVDIPTTKPLFVYIPMSGANNFHIDNPLGISLYANALDTLKSLDVAFDAFQQEIVLGRRRIIVPATAIRTVVNTDGKQVKYFDPSDIVYQAFKYADASAEKIIDNTVSLRIDELKLAIQTLLNILAIQCGFSAGSISFDTNGLKTATEVISENSKTFKTKQSYENNIGKGILDLLESIRAIGAMYDIPVTSAEYTITWNDSIIEDRNSKTDYWIKRFQAGTCTLEEILEQLDGMTEEQARKEAEKIKKDNATVTTIDGI